jgi:hypothetical protein
MMEALNKLIAYFDTLDQREFKMHIIGFLVGVFGFGCFMVYSIQSKKTELLQKLRVLNTQTIKAYQIIENNREIVRDELRLRQKLDLEKDFSIRGYFEQFYRDQALTPDGNWETRTESMNEKFDEILLPVTFKDLTSDRLVKALVELNKKDIVFVKECIIKATSSNKINVTITIATKRYKSTSD